ncbi:hypothetical protein DSO57_1002892 [Entomophthora muscae]|uniref:Uncharacterized protein n=1 Tax=Entomophthora muscae TaxID=34485 RepID=A0ACC2SLD5_9FUNG|nr:hypothetical protein DSO57_1002892 [Entomophthora muscae]
MGTVVDIGNIDIVSGMNGLPILPVTKATFLQVQSTLKALHLAFPTLETAGLIHQGRLVWSGTHLPIEVALFLTDLAKGSASLSEDPLLQLDGKKPRASFLSNLNPFFFTSGNNSQDAGSMGLLNFHPGFFTSWSPKSPYWGRCGRADTCEAPLKTFHLGSPPSPIQCGLFRCWRDGYLVLFFSDDSLSTPLLDKLDLHLHTQPLTDLEAHVKEDALLAREQIANIDKKYRYAHYNGMNLALHSHLASLTPEVHSILLDLQTQTKKLRPNPQASVPLELLVRTAASPRKPTFWVGARVTPDSSLFFVIHRDATLAEIEGNTLTCFHVNFGLEDITKISNECFTNLFLG